MRNILESYHIIYIVNIVKIKRQKRDILSGAARYLRAIWNNRTRASKNLVLRGSALILIYGFIYFLYEAMQAIADGKNLLSYIALFLAGICYYGAEALYDMIHD